MKSWCFLLCTVLATTALGQTDQPKHPRAELWDKAREATYDDHHKDAAALFQQIETAARADGAIPEAVSALAHRFAEAGKLEGVDAHARIGWLKEELPKWPEEAQPMLQTILAIWFWNYYRANSYDFLDRTATAGAATGEDPSTWDLARLLREVDARFQAVLAEEERLKAWRSADFDPHQRLLEGWADDYRPTMFDIAAHMALEFYQSGGDLTSGRADGFQIEAESPVFGPVEEFLAWKPPTAAEDSLKLRAVRLMQKLLRFHREAGNSLAAGDLDLARLKFGVENAVGAQRHARYVTALQRFLEAQPEARLAAKAHARWAEALFHEGDFAAAREMALLGVGDDESQGERHCADIITEVESREAWVRAERVWNAAAPELVVTYKNLTKAHFRIVALDWPAQLRNGEWNPDRLNTEQKTALAEMSPVREWSADLPATADFRMREQRLEAPADLDPGSYLLLCSFDADFSEKEDNQVTFAPFFVSDLALVMHDLRGDQKLDGFVLHAVTGEPISGAKVRCWLRRRANPRNFWEQVEVLQTDADGRFSFPHDYREDTLIGAEHGGHFTATFDGWRDHKRHRETNPHPRTFLFADRAIYRPGQTIHFKGIATERFWKESRYRVLPGKEIDVRLFDANHQIVAEQTVTTNSYGSFSGRFTAPRDRLTGEMTIRTRFGRVAVVVEEYKRPKFKVALEAPQQAVRLGEEVAIRGTALDYTGAPVDGGQASYRVVREVRYPRWWTSWRWWWSPPQPEEIAFGTVETNAAGEFAIRFRARPAPGASEADEPSFRFRILADVTDSAGETRSGERTIEAGFTALRARMEANEWQQRGQAANIEIATESLDGLPRAATGTVVIHRLQEPQTVRRPEFVFQRRTYHVSGAGDRPNRLDASDPNAWELGEVVAKLDFAADETGRAMVETTLEPGIYRAVLETRDPFGKIVTARLPLQVLDPDARQLGLKIPFTVVAPRWKLQPGDEFTALWGSGHETARAFVEILHRGEPLAQFWTEPGQTQTRIRQTVGEELRGGFQLLVTMVRDNRLHTRQRKIEVPWTNKQLSVKWERQRSALKPGEAETWTAVISGPDAKPAAAELVATLYDESLDAFLPHRWPAGFDVFYQDRAEVSTVLQNRVKPLSRVLGYFSGRNVRYNYRYRELPYRLTWEGLFYDRSDNVYAYADPFADLSAAPARPAAAKPLQAKGGFNLDSIAARRDLRETAFFLPHIESTAADGKVRLSFTMPETLTSWKFLGFAHDRELRSGFFEGGAVTSKDIMVRPNPPRFVREGDEIEFTVKVLNRSDRAQTGSVRLTFADLETGQAADSALGNAKTDQPFEIPPRQSRSFSWRIHIPDGQPFLRFKTVAATSEFSDGEEDALPVLPRRVLVTESLPLAIRGPGEKTVRLPNLLASGQSQTLRHQRLTLQMTPNPAWYAVLALPYLMEFPHECAEQTFNRLYANALAQTIVSRDERIGKVFQTWRDTADGQALDSPLEKHADLKLVALEESPWLLDGQDESAARRRIGRLFEPAVVESNVKSAHQKLRAKQLANGAWPWFSGGQENAYLTTYIVAGFARLKEVGAPNVELDAALEALPWIDLQLRRAWEKHTAEGTADRARPTPLIAFFLYARSQFLQEAEISAEDRPAVDFYLDVAAKRWKSLRNRQSKAHLALALQRFGAHDEVPGQIVDQLRNQAVENEEFGMFWRDAEGGPWWYRAPIETQALMIELFDVVAEDAQAVEDLQVWLLKQKQTRNWKTTKATADAVHALLARGRDWLAPADDLGFGDGGGRIAEPIFPNQSAALEVRLGGQPIEAPAQAEAGTGFFEKRFFAAGIEPRLGEVTLRKTGDGVAWGGLHWQYLESLEAIDPNPGTALQLTKALFVRRNGPDGPVLHPFKEGDRLAVGDDLVSRLTIRTDRDLEYVHLKNRRGSGTEPRNVLSRYRFQGRLAYYESTRDTASHFFIDYLPVGSHVIETAARVFHAGRFQSGTAEIQCMYAPEFAAHSGSFELEVE